MNQGSEFNYILAIIFFAVGIIGMLGMFTIVGPLAGILFFWVVLGAAGYVLYRLLSENS